MQVHGHMSMLCNLCRTFRQTYRISAVISWFVRPTNSSGRTRAFSGADARCWKLWKLTKSGLHRTSFPAHSRPVRRVMKGWRERQRLSITWPGSESRWRANFKTRIKNTKVVAAALCTPHWTALAQLGGFAQDVGRVPGRHVEQDGLGPGLA